MSKPVSVISEHDFIASIADALQYIAVYHPPSFVRALAESYRTEDSPAARDAIAQILINSKMAAYGRRPICQDTGAVNVFVKIGMGARIDSARPLAELVNDAVRLAYTNPDNPLRASIIRDPLFDRTNTRDNTPAAVVHFDMIVGDRVTVTVAAKGGGSENKAKFTNLDPAASVTDWVVQTVETLGAGWCPPGLLGIGVGGSAEKAMCMAKEALFEPIDMSELLRRGPSSKLEEMRIEIYDRVNALGVGAQGLGGLTTVVDVKIQSFPCHAASKPVGLIPQCAADRHITFSLDGSGPAQLTPPDLSLARCRFRFQCETGGVRELKALREMSPAAFSVSTETGSAFFRFQLGLIDHLIDRTMNPCRGASTTQMIPVGLRPSAALFSYAAC